MNRPARVTRRGFLGRATAAGAFVLGTRLVPAAVFAQPAGGPWLPGV